MIAPVELPYGPGDLEPVLSEQTMLLHFALYERYIQRVNQAVTGVESGQQAVQVARANGDLALLHNAQQVVNHAFAFRSMKPPAALAYPGQIRQLVESQWGDYAAFRNDWVSAAAGLFGSGYVWLVLHLDEIPFGQLRILALPNSDQPNGTAPLLAMDVWEHAWYLDHPLMRARYAEQWLDSLADWEIANERLNAGVA